MIHEYNFKCEIQYSNSIGLVLAHYHLEMLVDESCPLMKNRFSEISPRSSTGLVPVSYTHLDVYKRQSILHSGQML